MVPSSKAGMCKEHYGGLTAVQITREKVARRGQIVPRSLSQQLVSQFAGSSPLGVFAAPAMSEPSEQVTSGRLPPMFPEHVEGPAIDRSMLSGHKRRHSRMHPKTGKVRGQAGGMQVVSRYGWEASGLGDGWTACRPHGSAGVGQHADRTAAREEKER